VVPLEPPADVVYGALRARLEEIGHPIGANDLFVAAHALALRYTLVTDNEREFSPIKALPSRTGCVERRGYLIARATSNSP